MTLVLANCAALTMDARSRLLHAVDIRVAGQDIAAIVATGADRRPDDEVVDCSDTLVIPGLVNAHTHAGTGLLRGLAEDKPREFWASYRMPVQDRLGVEDYVASAHASCAEFLLNGVTCIADRFGHMDRIGQALDESGIRAVLGPTVSDASGPAEWRSAEAAFERWGSDPARRIGVGLAPHALDTVSDELLRRCAREAEQRNCRVFVHVAQSAAEVERLHRRGHDGALACLRATGLAGPHVVAAHCIYLRDDEIAAWPESRISIAHCPASNIKIEGRTMPLARLIGAAAIGIGTDWAASDNAMDMLAECRVAALVGKLLADDPAALPVEAMLRMATIDGARVLGLDHLIGSVEAGKRADLVVVDLANLAANPRHDPAANLLYSIGVRGIRDVLVDGRMLVRGGRLHGRNEAALAARLDALSRNSTPRTARES